MGSQTTQVEKEKVRLVLDTKGVPEKEINILLDEKGGYWQKSKDGGDFWRMSVVLMNNENICPTLLFNIREQMAVVEERWNKKIQFTYNHGEDNYLFGINEFDNKGTPIKEEDLSIWRLKQRPNSGGAQGSGTKGGFPPQPLAELFIGTIEECNNKLRDESKKWYLAEQKIFLNETDGYKSPLGYAILKRNRYTPVAPTPTQAPSLSS